jgi:electron transfer flavoprotein beta subunit
VNVTVLIAGIADPKWPLDGRHPRVMSPFDESALEVVLKLRDARPETAITVLVAGGRDDEPLARAAAGHRADRLLRVEIDAALEWDIVGQAAIWKEALGSLPQRPDLVALGREFGDRDDGALPACLAQTLGWHYASLAQEIRLAADGLQVMRERGTVEERIGMRAPLVASVTNDRRNRLRHPLMKNVMAAKRAPIESIAPGASREPLVKLEACVPIVPRARAARCRMLEGSLEARIAGLAEFLGAWRAEA